MTGLTGLTEEMVENGIAIEEAVAIIRKTMHKNAILVGHTVLNDVQWIGLEEKEDFGSMLDLNGLW
jgi:DNA polymerase III epsilon subunit-like protein